jgi:4-amino-4-deoxy-L-arabinose transferase-like glycosyltransferase
MTALALLGIFLLGRAIAGSFAGILAVLIVGSSPVTLALANNPNSHAAALCFVTWGMYLLLGWWQGGGIWRAVLAGVLLGFAATIRYTEGLLVLPLALAAIFTPSKRRRSWGQIVTLLAAWIVLVALVLALNYATLGRLTGYDATGESRFGEAFKWEYFCQNWAMMLRQLNGVALFGALPIGVLGLLILLAVNFRLTLLLWTWLIPGLLLYTSYYWAPAEHGTVHYLRLLLTLLPPIALGAAWILAQLRTILGPTRRWAGISAALAIVLAAGAFNVWNALPMLDGEFQRSRAVALAAEKLMNQAKVPPGSVVFAPEEFLNHLQFVSDYRLYLSPKSDARGEHVIANAIKDHRRVFLIEPGNGDSSELSKARRLILSWTEGQIDAGLPPATWRLTELTSAGEGN